MRLLVISDIHGNIAALRAVLAEPHDGVLCLGDLVGYGPAPAACVALARAGAWLAVAGNHDRTLTHGLHPGCRAAFLRLAEATVQIGRAQVSGADLDWLRALPERALLDSPRPVLLVHAAPTDPLHRYLAPDAGAWSAEVAGQGATLLLVGHTHLQFDLRVAERRVVNPGSVGMPKDGDPRAAYALLDGDTVELKRAAYDPEETIAALAAAGLDGPSVAALGQLLRSGSVPAELR